MAEMIEAGSLWDLITKRAEATPDDLLVTDESGRSLTFGAYRDEVEAVAAGLQGLGIGADSVVSWELPTWIESMVLVGALSRLQATQNPILHIYREREVGFIVKQAETDLLITPSEFGGFDFSAMASSIAADTPGLDTLVVDREGLPKGDPATLPPPPAPTSADEAADKWFFYTSGTTSDPKGARHTDHTIMAVSRGMCEYLRLTPEDRSALVFPFPHIGGIIWLYSGLLVGFVNVIDQAFNPATTVDFLDGQAVTLAGAGTFFHQTYLAKKRESDGLLASVRGFPGGGAPKPPQLHHDIRAAWPDSAGVLSGYGLTEAPILTMATPDDPDEALANTEGAAMPGVDLKLVTPEGKIAGIGEEGEVRAKAPQLMRGYLDPALDDAAFDEDGYFRTGDLGVLDADGFLTITGRLKDVIIRKGENVSAKEVEDLLFTHPSVADVAVIGLPDADTGERVVAITVTPPDTDPLTFDTMRAHLEAAGLITRKWPEQLEHVEALPRNPAGKVLKFELKARFENAPFTRG